MTYSKDKMSIDDFKKQFRENNLAEAGRFFDELDEGTGQQKSYIELSNGLVVEAPVDDSDNASGDTPKQPRIIMPKTGESVKLLKVARYKNYKPDSDQFKKDWYNAIVRDLDAFDALLFRAVEVEKPVNEADHSFVELQNNQKTLGVAAPELVKVLDSPNVDNIYFTVLDDGTRQDSADGNILFLTVAADFIPRGSIVLFNENIGDDQEREVRWYVQDIYVYGAQSSGFLYVCIPAMGLIQTADGEDIDE